MAIYELEFEVLPCESQSQCFIRTSTSDCKQIHISNDDGKHGSNKQLNDNKIINRTLN